MSKEYTYQDVAEHNTKKDIFVVIHDKVYDCSKFIDEHPYVLPAFPANASTAIPLLVPGPLKEEGGIGMRILEN